MQRRRGQDRHEYQRVLRPLMRPQGPQQSYPRGNLVIDLMFDGRTPRRRLNNCRWCINGDHTTGTRPNGDVIPIATRIAEATLPKPVDQGPALGASFQVKYSIRSDNFVEQAEVISNA